MFPCFRRFTSFRVVVAATSLFGLLCVYSFFFQSPIPPVRRTTMTTNKNKSSPSSTTIMRGYSFEVFGKVQGVSFRRYTQKKALELEIRGWIRNTYRNTVEGEFYYDTAEAEAGNHPSSRSSLSNMKLFLEQEGSPNSSIDRAVFQEWKEKEEVIKHQHQHTDPSSFEIRKTTHLKRR